MECQLRQVTGVCIAGCQPGRGLTIIQVCEVKWFVQQPLSAKVAPLIGVKVGVKEIGVGLPRKPGGTGAVKMLDMESRFTS